MHLNEKVFQVSLLDRHKYLSYMHCCKDARILVNWDGMTYRLNFMNHRQWWEVCLGPWPSDHVTVFAVEQPMVSKNQRGVSGQEHNLFILLFSLTFAELCTTNSSPKGQLFTLNTTVMFWVTWERTFSSNDLNWAHRHKRASSEHIGNNLLPAKPQLLFPTAFTY